MYDDMGDYVDINVDDDNVGVDYADDGVNDDVMRTTTCMSMMTLWMVDDDVYYNYDD